MTVFHLSLTRLNLAKFGQNSVGADSIEYSWILVRPTWSNSTYFG